MEFSVSINRSDGALYRRFLVFPVRFLGVKWGKLPRVRDANFVFLLADLIDNT